MGLVHRQARIPISGFGCPKMHAMVGVSLNERVDRSELINEHIHVWFGAGLVRMPAHCQI